MDGMHELDLGLPRRTGRGLQELEHWNWTWNWSPDGLRPDQLFVQPSINQHCNRFFGVVTWQAVNICPVIISPQFLSYF
jgi:hypothetical protein